MRRNMNLAGVLFCLYCVSCVNSASRGIFGQKPFLPSLKVSYFTKYGLYTRSRFGASTLLSSVLVVMSVEEPKSVRFLVDFLHSLQDAKRKIVIGVSKNCMFSESRIFLRSRDMCFRIILIRSEFSDDVFDSRFW